jgi:hypothetical protein
MGNIDAYFDRRVTRKFPQEQRDIHWVVLRHPNSMMRLGLNLSFFVLGSTRLSANSTDSSLPTLKPRQLFDEVFATRAGKSGLWRPVFQFSLNGVRQ